MGAHKGNQTTVKHGFYGEYLTEPWKDEWKKYFNKLRKKYSCMNAKNPQYLILVERAATAWIKLRQADEYALTGGRDVNAQHYAEKERALMRCMEQLMKYTESTKTESDIKGNLGIILMPEKHK